MNILTFDNEEWYIEKAYHSGRTEKYQTYDRYLNSILDLLDEQKLKASFFCVGGLAKEFPEVVKKIADKGHEIGCHSNAHQFLYSMDRCTCELPLIGKGTYPISAGGGLCYDIFPYWGFGTSAVQNDD